MKVRVPEARLASDMRAGHGHGLAFVRGILGVLAVDGTGCS